MVKKNVRTLGAFAILTSRSVFFTEIFPHSSILRAHARTFGDDVEITVYLR